MKKSTDQMTIPTLVFFLLASIPSWTQNHIVQSNSLYSNLLKEERKIQIILPKDFKHNSSVKYDVFYVLDGEWGTSLSERVYDFLEFAKFIPSNMMIVSIPNFYKGDINMRERDFTPTSTENKDGKYSWMRSSLISGGAHNFLLFLKNELIPFINSKYPTNVENNILYGTSSGGLFAIYAYLYEPSLFKSYLTVEPSLWWDGEYINKIAPKQLNTTKDSKNTLWISSRDGNAVQDMGISGFDSILRHHAPDNLQWAVQAYPNETHFSAIWKGLYDGLKYTYVKSEADDSVINRANTTDAFRIENGSHISFSKMDKFLEFQMDSIGIPGLSFAVINDGQIVYHRTLGVTNIETEQHVTDETVFDAASMTKTPFALMVLKLVDEGVLDLDRPLFTYLPNPDIAYDDRYKLITARMVLSHTTGFPNWRFFNKDGKLDIKFIPGTKYSYSGEAYEYLADVVAHLMDIEKNGLQKVFNDIIGKPLGMDTTYFTWSEWLLNHRATGHVDGKVAEGYGIKADNPNFYASHSMQTEAVNYSKFLIGIMKGEILQSKTMDEMLKVQYPKASESENEQWGLGLGIRRTEFGDEFYHGGFNLNFTSEFMFNKEQKFGYVLFTNSNKASSLNISILNLFHANGQ